MSKEKGKRGEREVRDLFREALRDLLTDVEVIRRNHQQAEIGGCDLVGVPVFGVEVKLCKKLPRYVESKQFQSWWQQACRQAEAQGLVPCLVYRENRGEWHVAMEFGLLDNECEVMSWQEFVAHLRYRVCTH